MSLQADPLYLGLEIGGTKLQVGLGRGDGVLLGLERRKAAAEEGARGIVRQIEAAVAALIDASGLKLAQIAAVGVGFGGPVDSVAGTVAKSHQVIGWEGFPLAGWLRDRFGIARVAVENDADAAGLAEALHGAGRGYSPLVYVTIGSGIGGGLIVDGSIHRGSGLGSMEIGHIWIDDVGGSLGVSTQLEQIASGWSIRAAGRELARNRRAADPNAVVFGLPVGFDTETIDAGSIAQAAGLGDADALAILERATRSIGIALAHATTLLAPRRIVLGGGVSLIGEKLWFEPIRQEVDRRVFSLFRGSFDIVAAELGEEVVVHGALALATQASQEPRL